MPLPIGRNPPGNRADGAPREGPNPQLRRQTIRKGHFRAGTSCTNLAYPTSNHNPWVHEIQCRSSRKVQPCRSVDPVTGEIFLACRSKVETKRESAILVDPPEGSRPTCSSCTTASPDPVPATASVESGRTASGLHAARPYTVESAACGLDAGTRAMTRKRRPRFRHRTHPFWRAGPALQPHRWRWRHLGGAPCPSPVSAVPLQPMGQATLFPRSQPTLIDDAANDSDACRNILFSNAGSAFSGEQNRSGWKPGQNPP